MADPNHAEVEQQAMYRIANAQPRAGPFPHLVVEDVLPAEYYAALVDALPPLGAYRPIAKAGRVAQATPHAYRQRHFIEFSRPEPERFPQAHRAFWSGFLDWVIGERFAMFALRQFGTLVADRFGEALRQVRFYPEFQLVRDFTDYALGPHTDSPHKVMALLFYCRAMPPTPASAPRSTCRAMRGSVAKARSTIRAPRSTASPPSPTGPTP